MKWIKRRTKERDEIESDRQKVEQTIMSSITKLPPGFSAKINVRRSNEDGDTDEEEEEIPFEEYSDDDDETQRIFTISAISSDRMPIMEEEAIEYHPTPPTFPVTPPPPEDSGESSSDEYPLVPPYLASPPPEYSDEYESALSPLYLWNLLQIGTTPGRS